MPEPVICPECKRLCSSGTGLSSHMRSMHTVEWRRQQESKQRPLTSVPAPSPPSTNGIRWEEPPARGRAARLIDELTPIVIELRRHPGKWARLRDFGAKGSASSSRKPIATAFPDLELRAAATPTGSAIWARHIEAGA